MRCKSVTEETPIDENIYKKMLASMMNDPSKKAILKKLMKADKDAVEKYKQATTSSPLNKVKSKYTVESPTAQFRRRLLENNGRSESATSSEKSADLPTLPFNKLLDGVKAYVEIRNNKEDRSVGVKALMESMGAEIMSRLSSQTTHVIYKEGSYETYRRAKAMNKHVVSVLWLQSLKDLRKRLPESDFPAIGVVSSNTTDICEYINSNYADIIKKEQNKVVTEPKKKRSKSVSASSSSRSVNSAESKKTSSTKLPESSDNSSCVLDDSNSVVPDTSKISSISGDSVICETPSPSVKNRRRTRMLYTDNISKLIEESRPKSTSKISRTQSVCVSSAKKLCRQTLFDLSNKSADSDTDQLSKGSSQSLEIGKFVTQRRKTRYSSFQKDDSLKNLSNGTTSLTSDCSSTDLSTESKHNTHSTDELVPSLVVSSNSTDRDMSEVERKMLSMALKNEIKEEYHGVTYSNDDSLSLKVSIDSDREPFSLSAIDNFSLRVSGNDNELEAAALQKKEFQDSTAESLSLKVSSANNLSTFGNSSLSFELAEEISQALCIINKDLEDDLSQKSECDVQSDCPENNAASNNDSAEEESSNDRDNEVEKPPSPPVRKSIRIKKLQEDCANGENGSSQNGNGVKKRRRKLYNPDGTLKQYFNDIEPEIRKVLPKNKNASVTFKKPEPVDLIPIILTQNAAAKLAMESGKSCSEDENAAMSADESLPIKPILNRRSTMDFVQVQKLPKTRRNVQSVNKPTIVCSRFHRNEVAEFKGIVERMGGFTVENTVSKNTTHLVLGDCSRTINVVKGMARGIWILKSDWLHSSLEHGRWLPEESFEYLELNKNIQICRREREAFGSSYSMDIFMDCGEIFVSNSTNPSSQQLKELIRLCKGVVLNCRRNAKIIVGAVVGVHNENALCVRETWVLDSIYQNCCKNPALYAIPSVDNE